MYISYWTELLINKCGCLKQHTNDSKILVIQKKCFFEESCNFNNIKNILLQDDPPKPLEFITSLVMTAVFTKKQIKKIYMFIFNVNDLQFYTTFKKFIKYVEINNLHIVEDSDKILSLKNNNFIL